MTAHDLLVRDLAVDYGRLRALHSASFELDAGGVLAILGANGAGKSTLARALSGLVKPAKGAVTFGEVVTSGFSAQKVARHGIAYVPEGRGVFPTLTVLENLKLAHRLAPTSLSFEDNIAQAYEVFPVLGERQLQRAGTMSGGEQQMLALSRAFCARPKLIVADELSLGLAPKVVEQVFSGLATARRSGISVIVIEQFVDQALDFADTALIMRRGTVAWSGSAGDAHAQLAAGYLGADVSAD